MDDEKSLGPVTGLRAGLVGCLILILICLMLYYTFWPLVKIAATFVA
ncbi:MAG: hypothetical protein QF475_01020 [Candidatus Undinarchaeales archaeon]|nr:hypothetical protein [Candidatus Undinarchaeales archaeon]